MPVYRPSLRRVSGIRVRARLSIHHILLSQFAQLRPLIVDLGVDLVVVVDLDGDGNGDLPVIRRRSEFASDALRASPPAGSVVSVSAVAQPSSRAVRQRWLATSPSPSPSKFTTTTKSTTINERARNCEKSTGEM
jgi:hypothetical protein